jgi:hypothetical protein
MMRNDHTVIRILHTLSKTKFLRKISGISAIPCWLPVYESAITANIYNTRMPPPPVRIVQGKPRRGMNPPTIREDVGIKVGIQKLSDIGSSFERQNESGVRRRTAPLIGALDEDLGDHRERTIRTHKET